MTFLFEQRMVLLPHTGQLRCIIKAPTEEQGMAVLHAFNLLWNIKHTP